MNTVTHRQAVELLHNKFVVVLGDSNHRSMYKDLVLLLQKDAHLTRSQLKSKGELVFEHDTLVEGGRMGEMTNGTGYREVRQFCTDHHLIRFYFATCVFSAYVETILEDFKKGIKPDVVVLNSCLWDVSRYCRQWRPDYKENLNRLFIRLKSVLPDDCLIIWNMALPLGWRLTGGFLVPEIQALGPMLRHDVIEANFYSATLANAYGLDVLDLHFFFRHSLQHRADDGVHWNALAHRYITQLLLQHIAHAWGEELLRQQPAAGHALQLYNGGPNFDQNDLVLHPRFDDPDHGFVGAQCDNVTRRWTRRLPPPAAGCTPAAENCIVMRTKRRRQPYKPYARQRPGRLYRC